MHIDHSKLVELLSEASGIEQKKVEKQLKELVDEIQQAISEGDAYEVEGFGIFSGIGNNLIFIPSEELSTEINYKYVGMEAISMDRQDEDENEDNVASEVDAKSDVPKEEEIETELEDDPFAGLLDDEPEPDEEETDPDDEPSIEEENPLTEESSAKEKPSYDDVFDDLIFGDEEGAEEQAQNEVEEKVQPGPEKWGIDSYRDENDENMFTGLLGNKEDTSKSEDEGQIEDEEKADEPKLSIQLDEESTSDSEDFDENTEDFDDPFKGFSEDEDENEVTGEAVEEDEEEIVPVITNISSGTGEKEEPSNAGLKPKTRSSMERKSSPILLWILLSLIILGGGAYALGYFGIINIPGIDAQYAGSQNTSMSINQPEATEDNNEQENTETTEVPAQPSETDPEESASAPVQEEQAPVEQELTNDVPEDIQTATNEQTYGLMGAPEAGANDGYTIVVYSLSQEANAENQRQQLLQEGYRALVYPLPHAQYGTIYRVSLGQFESLRDAALAAENLSQPFSENYFITKIQPIN